MPALPDGKVAKQVIAGEYHTVILAEDGTVFACGYNETGSSAWARSTGTPSPRCLPPGRQGRQAGGCWRNHTMILAEDGTVFACGQE